jgi:hypothetical protein
MTTELGARKSLLGLRLGQGVWLILVGVALALFVLSVPRTYAWLAHPCESTICSSTRLTPAGVAELNQLGISLETYARVTLGLNLFAAWLGFGVAALIVWRKPNDWLALTVALMLILSGLSSFSDVLQINNYSPNAPDAPPVWLAFLAEAISQVQGTTLILFLLLFPDGRFVPRWTAWLMALWLPELAVLFLPQSPLNMYQNPLPSGVLWFTNLLIGIVSQIYRYARVSNTVQRQQTKWLVYGLAINTLIFVPFLFASLARNAQAPAPDLFGVVVQDLANLLLQLSLTLTLAIAILRYRLWDIDILIRRTLIYSVLTVLLALFYLGAVVVLQQLFRAFTGAGDDWAIIISTLAIAALFNPLRRRVQSTIDQRFYRSHYNAHQVLARFAATARDEVELEKLSGELIQIVRETMQPVSVNLWLKKQGK